MFCNYLYNWQRSYTKIVTGGCIYTGSQTFMYIALLHVIMLLQLSIVHGLGGVGTASGASNAMEVY